MRILPSVKRLFAVVVLGALLLGCSDGKDSLPGREPPGPYASVLELAGAIQRGDITAVELLNTYLERIDTINPSLNAIVATDVAGALARAAQADEATANGESWGPLHGVPFTIKDSWNVAGLPATYGNPAFANNVPVANAPAVQRLVDAGAIIVGKTNTPLFAGDWQTYNAVYGTTNNPWDLSRTPGGSSGGAAAALVAGLTGGEFGDDLAGSLRVPASFSGVYSHHPSLGIIPMDGHFSRAVLPPAPEPPGFIFGVAGPMSRSAADLDPLMQVLGADEYAALPAGRGSELRDFRVAAWLTDPGLEVDAEVLDGLQGLVSALQEAGASVTAATPVEDLQALASDYRLLRLYSTGRLSLAPDQLQTLLATRDAMLSRIAAFFEEYDVLLAPAAPVVAFPHDQSNLALRTLSVNGEPITYATGMDTWPALAAYANLPVTMAPVGLSSSGLPVGVQIIGPNREDRTTLVFATLVEALIDGFRPAPVD